MRAADSLSPATLQMVLLHSSFTSEGSPTTLSNFRAVCESTYIPLSPQWSSCIWAALEDSKPSRNAAITVSTLQGLQEAMIQGKAINWLFYI